MIPVEAGPPYDPRMIRIRRGKVLGVVEERPGAVELEVDVDGATVPATAYPDLSGPVAEGDVVLLNTTAMELGLGTGGTHFVIAVEGVEHAGGENIPGRMMKARYTPVQTVVRSVEETHGEVLERSEGLDGTPVVVAPLHSMVGPAAAGAKAAGAERVVYVMTDHAALPGGLSRLVPALRGAGVLDGFVTAGQAFGGDLEAVTVWTALLAAREVLRADVVVVADGPGNLGTETAWGVTALESGNALNAAGVLGGSPVAAIRVSFADPRDRHRGLSHHSRTILSRVRTAPATVAVPVLPDDQRETLWAALRSLDAAGLELVEADGEPALRLLRDRGVEIESMGRWPEDDPAFFLSAGSAGVVAAGVAQRGR